MKREIRGVFIPVDDIHRARAWYRDALGLPVGEVVYGHLCSISLDDGLELLLDEKGTPDRPEKSGVSATVPRGAYPLFMFASDDIEASLESMQARGVDVVEYNGEAVQDGHWFNIRDSEGNLLMICAPRR